MSAAVMYCEKKFKKVLIPTYKIKSIYEAFESLEVEIKKLDDMSQLNLYSAATQFLESLSQHPHDSINPLEVFILRCNSIVGERHETAKKIGLALGVIVLSIAVVTAGAAVGIGIGMLMGLWQTPLMFMTALFAAESAPLIVASSSLAAGVSAGLLSQFFFFKEPKIKSDLNSCVEAIKQNYLKEKQPDEDKEEQYQEMGSGFKEDGAESPGLKLMDFRK